MNMKKLEELFISILKDEWGITEENYNMMFEFAEEAGMDTTGMFRAVDATDGRFYIT
jgi:effector-binding domain-containing protein